MLLKHAIQRAVWSVAPGFLAAAGLLVAIFSYILYDRVSQETKRVEERYTQYVIQAVDSRLKALDAAIMKEIGSSDMLQMFFSAQHTDDPVVNSKVSALFFDLSVAFPIVDSMYIVRFHDGAVLSRNTMMPASSYGDVAYIDRLLQTEYSVRWSGARTFREFTGESPRKVVTLVRKVPLVSAHQGIVVVNVAISSLQTILDDMRAPQLASLTIDDASGLPVTSEPADSSSRSFIAASPYTNWSFRLESHTAGFADVLRSLTGTGLLLVAATLLIGLAWLSWVSYCNARPLLNIMKRMSKEGFGAAQHRAQSVEIAVEELIERTKRYQSEWKEAAALGCQLMLQKLLEGEWGERELAAKPWPLPLPFARAYVLIVEMDRYAILAERYSGKDRQLYQFILSSVFAEVAERSGALVWCEWLQPNRMTVLVTLSEKEPEHVDERVRELCEQVRGWVQQHLPFTITIGASRISSHIKELPEAWEQALSALMHKMYGNNRTILHAQLSDKRTVDFESYRELLAAMGIRLRQGKEEWRKEHELLFDRLQQDRLRYQTAQDLLQYMIWELSKQMEALAEPLSGEWSSRTLPDWRGALQSAETLEEMRSGSREALEQLFASIRSIQSQSAYHALMIDVRQFIELEAHNPELSLQMLGDKFQISPKYASKLFKEAFGETFIDYVTRIRMDRAKQLLQETNMPIQDVAASCGYLSYTSFRRAFLKTVGMLPSEWSARS